MGIDRRIYTAGKNKSTLDPFVDEKAEDIKRIANNILVESNCSTLIYSKNEEA